jgi:hypothetical protein
MRGLLAKAPGVLQPNVQISKDSSDRMNNSVSVDFDPARTDRAAIIKLITDIWDISWFECSCGKTSAARRDCCGKAMKAAAP